MNKIPFSDFSNHSFSKSIYNKKKWIPFMFIFLDEIFINNDFGPFLNNYYCYYYYYLSPFLPFIRKIVHTWVLQNMPEILVSLSFEFPKSFLTLFSYSSLINTSLREFPICRSVKLFIILTRLVIIRKNSLNWCTHI